MRALHQQPAPHSYKKGSKEKRTKREGKSKEKERNSKTEDKKEGKTKEEDTGSNEGIKNSKAKIKR